MGRPSKLNDRQWEEIGKRLRAGEKEPDLAKEFKVSTRLIYSRFSSLNAKIKTVANQIVRVEENLKALPISSQIAVISLADELRSISINLAGAAKNGSVTAFKLSGIAGKQVDKINPDDPMESQETLQAISALTKMSNDAAQLGMNLINVNKDMVAASNVPPTKNKAIRIIKAEEMIIDNG